jgi:hypothetical protein
VQTSYFQMSRLIALIFLLPLFATAQQKFDVTKLKSPKKHGVAIANQLQEKRVYEYRVSKGKHAVFLPNGLRSSTKKLSNICFSPFNGVKVITHRSDMMEYGEDLWIANILSENENDDDDEYSYFDEDNDDEVDDESEDEDDNNDDNEMNEENNEIDEEKEESTYVYDYPLEYDVEL